MNAAVMTHDVRWHAISERALNAAARFWFAVAMIGQWAFFAYIWGFYGPSTLTGNFEAWKALRALGGVGYVAGDTAGNYTFAAHALAAGIVAFGGALQFIPQIRTHAPAFHRWNGRIFLATVVGLSFSGLYLVWYRLSPSRLIDALAITLNAGLILSFAAFAWRYARARRFAIHRRWALRLYLVSNAQWFTRIGVFAYFVVSMGLGHKASFKDPFFAFWMTVGCYLVPLAFAELYLRAMESENPRFKLAAAGSLVAITLAMAIGIFAFSMFSLRILSGAPLSLR